MVEINGKHTSKKVFKLITIVTKHTRSDSLKGRIPWMKKKREERKEGLDRLHQSRNLAK